MKPYLPYRPYSPYLAGSGPTELRASSGQVLDVNTVRIRFSSCVDINATTGIQVNIASGGWETVATVASGSEKVWTFTTTTAIAEGDTVFWQYLGAEDSIVDCVETVDVGALEPKAVTNGLELTAPTLVSIEVGTVVGNVFVFTYDEEVASTDFTLGWTIEAAETALTLESATVVSPGVVHVTTIESVYEGQEVLASYDSNVGDIVDVSGYPDGNALASITDEAVTNSVELTSLAIAPDAPTIDAGDTQQFTATGTYNNGGTLDITADVTWDSSNDSFATIAADGLATGVAEGSVTISATLGAISDTTSLVVEAAAVTLVSIAVTPDAGTIDDGATQQFTATGTYSDSSTANITGDVTWDSSDDAVATISAGGLATGVSPGQVTISATLGAVSGDTTLDVALIPWSRSYSRGWLQQTSTTVSRATSSGWIQQAA